MPKKSTKLTALQNLLEEHQISIETIERNDTIIQELKKKAEAVPDHRHPSYTKHLLSDIIMITFFALLANANEWGEIESFAKSKESWLRKYLALPYGIPTDDTFRLVIGNMNSEHFFQVTIAFLVEVVDKMLQLSTSNKEIEEMDILSVDGKESRGSRRKQSKYGKIKALQTLNVYSNQYGMCLAQKFIEEKTNEIPAAQEVLRLMDLKHSIITADAMNCQKETVEAIVHSKGEYVLCLKKNQGTFYEEVARYFEEEVCEKLKQKNGCYHKTIEKEHGGIATREYYITEDVGWYTEKSLWKKLTSFGMVKKSIKKEHGVVIEEVRYYIGSIKADVFLFERASRGHWGVENNLHWMLDVTFLDDKNTSMARTGAKNLQLMKKIVLAILNLVKSSYGLSMKRIRYVVSLNYEEEIEKMLSLLDINSVKKLLDTKQEKSKK